MGRGGAWVIGLSVLVSLLALLPIAFVIGVSVQTGWTTLLALVFRSRVGELFINTVLLVLITIPLCVALGVTLAWLTERSDLPGRSWWSLLATGFWALTSEIDYAAAAPYALLMILLSLPLTGLLYHQSKRTAGR